MSDMKKCRRSECNRVVDPNDPDSMPTIPQCGKCTRGVRRRNKDRLGKGFITASRDSEEES